MTLAEATKVLGLFNEYVSAPDYPNERQLRGYLTEELHRAAAKQSGGTTLTKRRNAALRIIKRADREDLRCAWVGDGAQYLCTGFVGFRLRGDAIIPGLPEPADGEPPTKTMPLLFDRATENMGSAQVTRSEARGFLAESNASPQTKGRPMPVGNTHYNAALLIDVMDVLGMDELTIWQGKPLGPGYVKHAEAEAIIAPVKLR